MNILFTTAHPAQIHNFKLLKTELEAKGHQVFWMATEKDISKDLLGHYNITYELLQRPRKGFISKFYVLIFNTLKAVQYLRQKKIEMIVSRVSPYLSLAGFFLRITHLALADTESSGIYNKLFIKFVSVIFTAKSFKITLRPDQLRFDGNIELFYLHPNRFSPSANVYPLLGINQDTPYIIIRFVSWDAYHDKGLNGFSDENKVKAVKEFLKYGRVFISSEMALPAPLEPYRIKIPPEQMHDVLAGASLFFGESATMASESAVLCTPAIYLNENWLGYTDDAERFGLLFSFKQDIVSQEKAIEKGIHLLTNNALKSEIRLNYLKFMESKIDPTSFMLWFIENYPTSFNTITENPDYQYHFK